MKTVIKVIVSVALLAVLGVGIGVFVDYINNGQKNFYVQYGEKKVTAGASDIELSRERLHLFYCKNVLGNAVLADEYDVALSFIGSTATDSFLVDGLPLKLSGSLPWAKGIDITKANNMFTIAFPSDFSITGALQKMYEGHSVENVPEIDESKDYFMLTVTDLKDNAVIKISFRVGGVNDKIT